MKEFDIVYSLKSAVTAFFVVTAPVPDAVSAPWAINPSCELPDLMITAPEDLKPWPDSYVFVYHLNETGADFVLVRNGRSFRIGVQSSDRPRLRPYKSGLLRDASPGFLTLGVLGARSETVLLYATCDGTFREMWVNDSMQNVPRLISDTP